MTPVDENVPERLISAGSKVTASRRIGDGGRLYAEYRNHHLRTCIFDTSGSGTPIVGILLAYEYR